MFRTIADFEAVWKDHAEGTAKLLAALTRDSLSKVVSEGHRDLGRMAWHIVTSIPEMAAGTGLKVEGAKPDDPMPRDQAKILAAYKAVSESLLQQVKRNWKDETLLVEDNLYGMTWKRGLTLLILLQHEIHHRAQMTVLMRQAGLKVPGVFGPSKEEWSQYGGQPPEI